MAGVGRRVRHDEPGASVLGEGRVEGLNPEVVAVVGVRDAEREALVPSELVLVDTVDVERRVRHHVVKAADRLVKVVVVGVALTDIAGETVERQVHLGQRNRDFLLLLAVDRQPGRRRVGMAPDELGALDEHAARSAGRIEHAPLEGLEDLDDQPHDRVRREELTAESSLGLGEVGEEIFVDQPEGVARQLPWQRSEQPTQLDEDVGFHALVAAREDIPELGVGGFHGLHGLVDRLAEVRSLGQLDQRRQSGGLRHVEDRPGLVVVRRGRVARRGAGLDLWADLLEPLLGVGEEDQSEHRAAVLGRPQARVGPHLVGGLPQRLPYRGKIVRLQRIPHPRSRPPGVGCPPAR